MANRRSMSRPSSSIAESKEARPVWESAYRGSISERRDSNTVTGASGISTGSVGRREPVSEGILLNHRLLAWRFVFVPDSHIFCFGRRTIVAHSAPHALHSTNIIRTLSAHDTEGMHAAADIAGEFEYSGLVATHTAQNATPHLLLHNLFSNRVRSPALPASDVP